MNEIQYSARNNVTQLAGIHALPFQGAFDVVAIASSAGGLSALGQILAVLPVD